MLEHASNPELQGFSHCALDPSTSIEAGLIDIGGEGAPGEGRQVQSAGEGNQASRHLQDGQEPPAGMQDALRCLQVRNTTQEKRENYVLNTTFYHSFSSWVFITPEPKTYILQ